MGTEERREEGELEKVRGNKVRREKGELEGEEDKG